MITPVHHLDYTGGGWRRHLAEIEKMQHGYMSTGEQPDDLAARRNFTGSAIDHLGPDEYSWADITTEWMRDEATGRAHLGIDVDDAGMQPELPAY